MECPACGDEFDVVDGVFTKSFVMEARVLVCIKHKSFTPDEEKRIDISMDEAKRNKRGRIEGDRGFIKKSEMLDKMTSKELERIMV
jgi:ssDNA-binding Zn-finger/Zn-ribbon topoisomerase 1